MAINPDHAAAAIAAAEACQQKYDELLAAFIACDEAHMNMRLDDGGKTPLVHSWDCQSATAPAIAALQARRAFDFAAAVAGLQRYIPAQ
jgi:hypothetical protein